MENFINLLDGTRIEAKVNFGTLYYLQESGAVKMTERLEKMKEQGKESGVMDQLKIASRVIYAILRSNGKKVTVDEAMSLVPADAEEVENVLNIFAKELAEYKKKEKAKSNMKTTH